VGNPDGESMHRRRFARTSVDLPVTVIVPGHELVLSGSALDLSGGGVRVATTSELPAGQVVMLRIRLTDKSDEMLLRGRVVLSFYDAASGRFAHGIAFTSYAQRDQDAILAFVEATGARPDIPR
jgi:Tfp pilus assembly protein PilZ